MQATMRDTSADYRTYWIRDGMYYGKARSLGAAPCVLPPDKLAQLPENDQKLLLNEIEGNPSFCSKVAKCMADRPDWAKLISTSAKEAIVNEFNPSKFPNRKGMWPKLRATMNDFVGAASSTIKNKIASMTLDQKTAALKEIAKGGRQSSGQALLGNLGVAGIFDFLASAIETAGNMYTTDLVADTREDIARIQANAAMNTFTAQQSIANAQAAIAAAQTQQAAIQSPVGAAISTITTSTVGGIPVLLIAIPLVGALIYMFMKK